MDFGITTISSKGQIVIPKNLRKSFKKGDKLLLVRNGDIMFLRHAKRFEEKLADDLEFERRTSAALRRYEKNPGSFKTMPADEFLKELKKW